MKLTLEVSAEEFDAAVKQQVHATSVTELVIRQEDGLLSASQRIVSVCEIGSFARKQWGLSVDRAAILVYTTGEETQDGDGAGVAGDGGAGQRDG